MSIVTQSTNRVDTFAAAHGISEADLVRWNLPYFTENSTFWLPVGDDFNTFAPPGQSTRTLLVDDGYLIVNDRYLGLRPSPTA